MRSGIAIDAKVIARYIENLESLDFVSNWQIVQPLEDYTSIIENFNYRSYFVPTRRRC